MGGYVNNGKVPKCAGHPCISDLFQRHHDRWQSGPSRFILVAARFKALRRSTPSLITNSGSRLTTDTLLIRCETYFKGRVQGVGFRYQTARAARGRAISGFVRNLADGRVHLVAEGTPGDVDEFLGAIQELMSDYIQDSNTTRSTATGEFVEFSIRH